MKKEFTKADLKDGMVVEYNDNCFGKRLVVGGFLIGEDGYADLGDYNENLKSWVNDLEIVRVYKIKHMRKISSIMKGHNLELIWERKEPKKMTVEEMRQKLEELTGEKIEVEPSIEEKCWELEEYCDKTPCSDCCLSSGRCTWNADADDRENVEECYKKIMEQENRGGINGNGNGTK